VWKSWKTLPGRWEEHDKVLSLCNDPFVGIKPGDVGVVAGKAPVDRNERVRCWFGNKSVNIGINQIAQMGEKVGSFHTGELVVSNLLEGSIVLLNGETLQHGKIGKVLKAGRRQASILCYFKDGPLVDIEETRIKSKQLFMWDLSVGMKASKDIEREQRKVQKDIVRQARLQCQADSQEAPSQAEETHLLAVGSSYNQNTTTIQEEDTEVHDAFLCPTCLDLLVDPVTLRCGHTICKSCVETWKGVCGPTFKTPCCARVTPYEFRERSKVSRDIEELYPRQAAIRIANIAEQHEMQHVSERPTGVAMTSLMENALQGNLAIHGQ